VASGIWDLRTAERQRSLNQWTGQPPSDPYFANVSLLLHFDGEAIVDSSQRTKTVTMQEGAQLSAAQSKFGSGSLSVGNVAVVAASDSDFEFGTDPFTIEFWFFLLEAIAGETRITSIGSGSNNLNLAYGWLGRTFSFVQDGVAHFAQSFAAPPLNQWQHLAYCRDGSTAKLFLNGSQIIVSGNAGGISVSAGSVTVGGFNGYLDDVRVTKGIARYSDDFTPPAAAFPDQ
jgi:hypothetical protein